MNNEKYRRLTSWLIAAWFVFPLLASTFHLFQNPPKTPPIAFGMAVLVPFLVFLGWYWTSQSFRAFVLSLDLRVLTMLQSWRIAGFGFLALYTYKVLPGSFALPAGWGDFVIGLTAPLVALSFVGRQHRVLFVLWQILGMLDLVTAVILGVLSGFLGSGSATMDPMTVLPLSLIPTFGVPLFFILHMICIAQARQWQKAEHSSQGVPIPGTV
jgi:hypothetical protein